jgi:hypothetical protein
VSFGDGTGLTAVGRPRAEDVVVADPGVMVSVWYRRTVAMTLRTDDELERALSALAEAEGISRQEVVRRAVLERFERNGHAERVEESARRLAARWGDVLQRLGTV